MAFDKISAVYFTPFTIKYFAYDGISSSLIPRVCFTLKSLTLDCPLWICNPHQDATFAHAYPAPTQCIMQHQRETCVRATPSRHVACRDEKFQTFVWNQTLWFWKSDFKFQFRLSALLAVLFHATEFKCKCTVHTQYIVFT